MSEPPVLSAGRILWLQEECHDLVAIYHQATATRQYAREQILRTLAWEMRLDGLKLEEYREAVETILDTELERQYK